MEGCTPANICISAAVDGLFFGFTCMGGAGAVVFDYRCTCICIGAPTSHTETAGARVTYALKQGKTAQHINSVLHENNSLYRSNPRQLSLNYP